MAVGESSQSGCYFDVSMSDIDVNILYHMVDAYGSSSWNSWIPKDLVSQIGNLKTRNEMWETIKTHNLGADRVKEARLQTVIMELENLKMSDNDTIDAYVTKVSGISPKSATLGEVMSKHKQCIKKESKKKIKKILKRIFFMLGPDIPTRIMTQAEEEDVAHTLEVVDEVEVKDMVRATRKTKYIHFDSKFPEQNRNHEVNLNEAQEKGVYHEEGMFFMMNHIKETIFINEEKYTSTKSESNTDNGDDVWYFDNGASNHMTGIEVSQGNGFVEIKQERYARKILKKLGILKQSVCTDHNAQATISGYDISIRGIEVSQGNGFVEIKQERYARKILKEAHMEDCNATLCPIELRLKLSKAEDEPESIHAKSKRITCSCYQSNIRYLKGTTSFGIKYKRGNDMRLVRYSSHNVDIHDGWSTIGHVFYLGTSPITWCSQKQTTVALSSCEAKFMAATAVACQAIWLREVMAEVMKNEQVIVEHVCEENQKADPLTKALARIRFKEMRLLLSEQELPSSTQKFKV
uniref:Zinc finger, CCHC-type n=1 Tax=Tanacetum cinerariifolium TaxID=118510 RepID=A0A6L2MED4_TANCI|nr:hypothetical protein [Tanacetum cinerariifolium]